MRRTRPWTDSVRSRETKSNSEERKYETAFQIERCAYRGTRSTDIRRCRGADFGASGYVLPQGRLTCCPAALIPWRNAKLCLRIVAVIVSAIRSRVRSTVPMPMRQVTHVRREGGVT